MKLKGRIVAVVMAVVLVVLLLPAKATAVETDSYYEEFGITYEQLFVLYPEYLHSKAEDTVTDIVIEKYTDVLGDYSAVDDFVTSYIYILRQNGGFSFYLREIMASLNLAESTKEKMAMDTMMLLLRNICNNRIKLVDNLVSDVEDNFSAIKGVYDIAKASDREEFVATLQGVCNSLSDKQVADITETIFSGELKEVFDKLDDTIDLADKIITIFATFELEVEIINTIRDAAPENSGLREQIDLFLANRCTVSAFIKYYGSEDVLKLVDKAIIKAAKHDYSIITVAFEILEYGAEHLYPGPDAADLQRAIALSGYINGIYSGVASKRLAFAQSSAITDKDISDYEILYGAYIEAIRTTLESTKSLASGYKKDAIESAISICDTLTYDKYISICMEELKEDIDAGIVEPPEDLIQEGTPGVSEYLTYEIIDGVVTITGCDTAISGEFAIPSHIQGCPVRKIESRAFYDCHDLTSVIIPNGVVSIGDEAFWGNDEMTSVFIPASVTSIGCWAFGRSILGVYEPIEVYIVDPNRWIGGGFYKAFEEYSVHVVDTNGNEISEIVLSGTITEIPSYAFVDFRNITKITIPDGPISIGAYSFSGCESLISISVPDSVTSIGEYAFSDCDSLISISVPDSVTSIGKYAFSGCNSLTCFSIPDGVTAIENCTFSNCQNLIDVHIPNSVVTIGEDAFYNCWALTNITMPDSLRSIEFGAFHDCRKLTSVILPEGLTSIGGWAFALCDSLSEVVIPQSVSQIGWNAFLGLKEVTYCGTAAQLAAIKDSDYNFRNVEVNYHDWEYELVKSPTYTAMGEQVAVCEYCGEETVEKVPAKFYGTSVNLGNTLDMYFGFYTGLVDENGKVVFVREFADGTTETTEAPITSFKKNNSVYDITYTGLAAKEMCDTIHITVYDGEGNVVGQHSDSIRSYILRQLREKDHEAEFRTLCIDLLNYGAAAQTAFGYNVADLANKELTAEELAEGTQKTAKYKDQQVKTGNADSYYGTAYFLETQISMSMAVRADDLDEGCYALVSYIDHTGTEKKDIRLNGVKDNSVYEFVLNEIVVADGRCLVTVDFYKADGTKVVTVQDSMESYTARKASEYPLAEKMLAFSDAAYKYLHRNDK